MIKNKFNGATLSGASSIDDGATGFDKDTGTTTSSGSINNDFRAWSGGEAIVTVVVNVPAGSLVVIMACGEMGNGGQQVKIRNTTTSSDKGSKNFQGNLNNTTLESLQVVDTSPSVGNNTYQLQAVGGGTTSVIDMRAVVIDLTDTHAGVSKKINDIIR